MPMLRQVNLDPHNPICGLCGAEFSTPDVRQQHNNRVPCQSAMGDIRGDCVVYEPAPGEPEWLRRGKKRERGE